MAVQRSWLRCLLFGIVPILCVLSALLPTYAVAQLEYYTTLKRGTQIPIPTLLQSYGGLLVYLDTKSCVTCNLNAGTVVRAAIKRAIPVVVYARTSSATEFEEINKQFSNCTVIHDELGAYASLHHVTQYAVVAVVDRYGTVEYVGTPGAKEYFDYNQCLNALDSAVATMAPKPSDEFDASSIRPLFTVTIPNGAKLSPYCAMLYARSSRRFIVLDMSQKMLHRFSYTGKLEATVNLSNPFPNIQSYQPKLVYVSASGDSALIYDSDLMSATPVVYWVILQTGEKSAISLPQMGRTRMTTNMMWDERGRLFLIAKRPLSDAIESDTDQHSVAYINAESQTSLLGSYTPKLRSLYSPNFYWACFTLTKDYLVEIQSISKQLTSYEYPSMVEHTVTLDYPNEHNIDMFSRIRPITSESTIEQIRLAADSSQVLFQVIGSMMSNSVVVFSRMTPNHYPNVHRIDREAYIVVLSRHDVPSGRCTGYWMMPEGYSPKDVEGNILYATDFKGSIQRVVTMSLE